MKGFMDTSGSSIKERGHGISLNKDDRVHGSLLITTELFMNCILKAEVSGSDIVYEGELAGSGGNCLIKHRPNTKHVAIFKWSF